MSLEDEISNSSTDNEENDSDSDAGNMLPTNVDTWSTSKLPQSRDG